MSLTPNILLALLLCSRGLANEDPYVEGEVLVTFKQDLATNGAEAALGKHALKITEHYDKISQRAHRLTVLVREKNRSTAQLIATLKAEPLIETVEPNYIRRVTLISPNDPDFPKLWALQNTGQTVNSTAGTSGVDTKFLAAWRLARPPAGEVVVGVIDTGMDISHPDLLPNLWVNPGEIPGNGIDDDADGFIDDAHGYDFTLGSAAISDSGYHGTHVAGTIAAVGKNNIGVIGMDYRAKIIPMKASSDGDNITTSATLAAYNYAVTLKQKGVNIVAINASFGGGSFSTSEQTAITALRDAGIILCAAAGNGGTDSIGDNNDSASFYPANYAVSNVISVAALDQNNALASFSNYGATTVDLAAPGVNIDSTEPLNLVTGTASVAQASTTYSALAIIYSGITSTAGITKPVYSCGIGNTNEFPAGVSGNIALIQRGTLTFAVKVTNAMNAGAVAAVVYDNTANALNPASPWTLGANGNWIPALQVTQATGQAMLAALPASGTVINHIDPSLAYRFLDGTSMATPQVAGAVAFAAMNFPTESVTQRISRILSHTTPVSTLTGKMTTGGRLNLLGCIDTDGDSLADWWEMDHFGNLSQIASGDPDGDGFINSQEFFSGTSPVNRNSHLAFSSFTRGTNSSANHFNLAFPSVEDSSYRVDWSDNLNTWSPLGSLIIGTGAPIQIVDPNALISSPKRFYRLSLLPE